MPAKSNISKKVLDIRVLFSHKDKDVVEYMRRESQLNERKLAAQIRFMLRQVVEAHING